jgi:hypothetical protein
MKPKTVIDNHITEEVEKFVVLGSTVYNGAKGYLRK